MTENFETVEQYASRQLQSFCDSVGLHDIVDILPDLNLKRLRSITEFDVAWSRVHRLIEQHPNTEHYNLPSGHPDGLQAFDTNALHIKRRRWEFMPHKIFPEDYVGAAGVWAILTIDERSNGKHICITRRGGQPGIVAARAIERLASNLFYDLSSCPEFIAESNFTSNTFHFYDHTPAILSRGLQESFAKVTMAFENGIFKNPKWQHYNCLPLTIQPVRIGLELIQAMIITELCL